MGVCGWTNYTQAIDQPRGSDKKKLISSVKVPFQWIHLFEWKGRIIALLSNINIGWAVDGLLGWRSINHLMNVYEHFRLINFIEKLVANGG